MKYAIIVNNNVKSLSSNKFRALRNARKVNKDSDSVQVCRVPENTSENATVRKLKIFAKSPVGAKRFSLDDSVKGW